MTEKRSTLTAEGVRLLREVQKRIVAEPERFNMGTWCSETACGTVACIAGHIGLMLGYAPRVLRRFSDSERADAKVIATGAIGIDDEIASELFYDSQWPEDLLQRLDEAEAENDPVCYASVACERIDRFIAEHAPSEGR